MRITIQTMLAVMVVLTPLIAQEVDNEKVIAKLVEDLESKEHAIWRKAVSDLAAFEVAGVEAIVQAIRDGQSTIFHWDLVFMEVSTPVAREAVAGFLSDEDSRLRYAASRALHAYNDAEFAPALMAYLDRLYRERLDVSETERNTNLVRGTGPGYMAAKALWNVQPTEKSAITIIRLARTLEASHRTSLLWNLDNPTGWGVMTEEERLEFLLRHKYPGLLGGPEAFGFGYVQDGYRQAFPPEQDRDFLDTHKEEILAQIRGKLSEIMTHVPAMLLGYFKDTESLSELRRLFIETKEFYGWESSSPDPLAYNQYPKHHCYELAIERIAGGPIEDVVELSGTEVNTLLSRIRGSRYLEGDFAAIYVLSRLKPQTARTLISEKFREAVPEARAVTATMMANHLLEKGIAEAEVRGLLGEPTAIKGDTWRYSCGRYKESDPHTLVVQFEDGALVSSKIELANRT